MLSAGKRSGIQCRISQQSMLGLRLMMSLASVMTETCFIENRKLFMITYPNIDPVAFRIAGFGVHWYGLMYLLGFLGGWLLLQFRAHSTWYIQFSGNQITDIGRKFTRDQITDLIFYGALGTIIGGRVGYVLFYDFNYFISHPLFLFQTWKGGMSFHGGLLGVMIALAIYSYHIKKPFLELGDFLAPVVPIGLATGRIGNFINAELWGRTTDVPWGMIFPNAGDLPRHPSQLYEFFLEGVVLFFIMWLFSMRPKPRGAVSGLFLMLYSVFRFGIEFFREPDAQVGYFLGGITEGQLLSIPMFLFGAFLFIRAYRSEMKLCGNI